MGATLQEMQTEVATLSSRVEDAGGRGRDGGAAEMAGGAAERLEAALRAEAAAVAEVDFLRIEREALEAEVKRERQAAPRVDMGNRTGFGLGRLARVGAGIEAYEWKDEPRIEDFALGNGDLAGRTRNGNGGRVRYAGVAAQATTEVDAPAWIAQSRVARVSASRQVDDSLSQSRERVASRWFALKGVFENGNEEYPERAAEWGRETKTPVLAVYSLTGGVGKTSLVAAVGRALSGIGEKVLLADTTVPGLLPYYFGAREVRPGVMRTFSPPNGSGDAAIQLVSFNGDSGPCVAGGESALACEIKKNGTGSHRVLVDLDTAAGSVIRGLAGASLTVLVPVAADMNTVISLQAVERSFEGAMDAEGNAILPYYVLNQFDASMPLQLDVREVLQKKLGDRLLPFAIRRAAVVGEALAEGMTVMDYAPSAPVAEDYGRLAEWVRSLSAPAVPTLRELRWSER